MVSHALGTSTSVMAFRVTFLRFDLDPKVATSLTSGSVGADISDDDSIPDGCNSVLTVSQDCTESVQAFYPGQGILAFMTVEHDDVPWERARMSYLFNRFV